MPFSADTYVDTSYMNSAPLLVGPVPATAAELAMAEEQAKGYYSPSTSAASSIVSSPSPSADSSSGVPTWMLLAGAALAALVVFGKK